MSRFSDWTAEGSATLTAQFVNPLTIIGLAIYIMAALCYILALKKIPVSIAFPSVAASYAVVAVLAHLLWNEPLGWPQLAGIVLIGSGVLLIFLGLLIGFNKFTLLNGYFSFLNDYVIKLERLFT